METPKTDIKQSLRSIRTYEKSLQVQKNSLLTKIVGLKDRKERLLKAQGVIDQTITRVSEGGIGKIESLVSEGLELVFPGEGAGFVVEKKSGAKGTSHRFLVCKGGVQGPPIDTFGGGIVNVVQLLLRVIMIQRFGLRKLLILDESFSNVSQEYLPMVSDLLRTLCEEQGFEILLITHQPILTSSADQVYQVSKGETGPSLRLLESHEVDELRVKDYREIRTRDSGETPRADP